MPSDPSEPLAEGDHLVNSRATRQVCHVVEACPDRAADRESLGPGTELGGRTKPPAFVGPAGGGGRVGGDRIVEAVAGRLNDHTMLDAKPFVELEQQFLWRIGRRVAA